MTDGQDTFTRIWSSLTMACVGVGVILFGVAAIIYVTREPMQQPQPPMYPNPYYRHNLPVTPNNQPWVYPPPTPNRYPNGSLGDANVGSKEEKK